MTTLSAPAATTGWSCPRCGLAPVELRPVQTVAVIRSLAVHFSTLVRHADPAGFVACAPAPGLRSALDHVAHVADELTAWGTATCVSCRASRPGTQTPPPPRRRRPALCRHRKRSWPA